MVIVEGVQFYARENAFDLKYFGCFPFSDIKAGVVWGVWGLFSCSFLGSPYVLLLGFYFLDFWGGF